jgi:hypothetical protein
MTLETKLNKMHVIRDKIDSLAINETISRKDFNFWNENIKSIIEELKEELDVWSEERELDESFVTGR